MQKLSQQFSFQFTEAKKDIQVQITKLKIDQEVEAKAKNSIQEEVKKVLMKNFQTIRAANTYEPPDDSPEKVKALLKSKSTP